MTLVFTKTGLHWDFHFGLSGLTRVHADYDFQIQLSTNFAPVTSDSRSPRLRCLPDTRLKLEAPEGSREISFWIFYLLEKCKEGELALALLDITG